MIASFIRPEHVVVLELSPRLTAEEGAASRESLERSLDATAG
jgi:hypothetical protein